MWPQNCPHCGSAVRVMVTLDPEFSATVADLCSGAGRQAGCWGTAPLKVGSQGP